MALTPLRWSAIAVAGMLTICILVFRPFSEYQPTPTQQRADSMYTTATFHRMRASRFARQYRMAVLTDSLRVASARDTARVIRARVSPDVHPEIAQGFDRAVAAARERIPAPRIGVDIVVLNDTSSIGGGYYAWPSNLTPFYILPSRAGERCQVVVPLGYQSYRFSIVRALQTDDARRQILGPCAYYASFGIPGNAVRSWLRERGGLFTLGGSWAQQSSSVEDVRQEYWYLLGDSTDFYPAPAKRLFLFSHRGVHCMVGSADACETAVLGRSQQSPLTAVGPALRLGYSLGPVSARDGAEFGGRETELLADMVRSVGRDRFGQFWSSNEPVPVAFQKASGMRLGEWVSNWAGEGGEKIERGPRIPGWTLIWALALVGGSVLAAAFVAGRRQFA